MKLIRSIWSGFSLMILLASLQMRAAVPEDRHWSAEFGLCGTTNWVTSVYAHQEQLYFANGEVVGNYSYIDLWDGSRFSRLAQLFPANISRSADMIMFGPHLYAGGTFIMINGMGARGLARWDGAAWDTMNWTNGAVWAFAKLGGDLIAGGNFINPGNVLATNVARWDGSAWHALGTGLPGFVRELLVVNGQLYAAGSFTNTAVPGLTNIAVWDGNTWSPVGGGLGPGIIYALAHDGTFLYAGGSFTNAGSPALKNIARWDGANWSGLSNGLAGTVQAMNMFNSRLCVGGSFGSGVNQPSTYFVLWDGTAWNGAGASPDRPVLSLSSSGTNLYVGGLFLDIGGKRLRHLSAWDGTNWSPVGNPKRIHGVLNSTHVLVGDGTNLYCGGGFGVAGTEFIEHIARYEGTHWHSVGSGLDLTATSLALVGTNLYAVRDAIFSGQTFTGRRLNTWDGNNWTNVGSAVFANPLLLAAQEIDLYIAGSFSIPASNGSASSITRWDGSNFHAVLAYDGFTTPILPVSTNGFTAFIVQGTNIYGSGNQPFTQCDTNSQNCVTTSNVFHFDGQRVRTLGGGLNASAKAIAVMGTNVFFAGPFTNAGGVTARGIARWDGANWWPVGSGVADNVVINALAVIGTNLYAGGNFTTIGGVSARSIARWNGATWSALGSGLNINFTPAGVSTLLASGQDLYMGGSIRTAGGKDSLSIARWNETMDFGNSVLTFSDVSRPANGAFTARVTAHDTPIYRIQRSSDFTTWTDVLTNYHTPILFVDSNAPAGPKHFYRALAAP